MRDFLRIIRAPKTQNEDDVRLGFFILCMIVIPLSLGSIVWIIQ